MNLQREQFKILKKQNGIYNLEFTLKNDKLLIHKIINFELIKLIYELNNDIYETIDFQYINENEIIILTVMKNLFQDLGLPQRYSYLNITKEIINDNTTFNATVILDKPNKINISENIIQMPFKHIKIETNIIDIHTAFFNIEIFLNNENIPQFIETVVINLWKKIFNRLKQFIENMNI